MLSFKQWCEFTDILPYLLGINLLNEHVLPQEQIDNIINNPNFQSWIKSLGVTEPFGTSIPGGVGVAYPSGKFIVKFTSDNKEAGAAAIMKGYDSPNMAKIFDVKRLASYEYKGNRKTLFAIVQERLNTDISKRHRVAGQAIYDYMDNNPGLLRSSIDKILHIIIEFLPPKYKKDQSTILLIKQMIGYIKKIQDDRGFLTQDTHGGNIALKGREPAFFDMGRSTIDYDNSATHGVRIADI